MPVLKNPRHERFAQELAKGKSASEAYTLAGYAFHDGNCIRLRGYEWVGARVSELQAANAAKAGITVESITKMLEDDRELARTCKQSAAAVQASTAIAKLNGLWAEDRKNDRTPLSDLTDEQLDAALTATKAAIADADPAHRLGLLISEEARAGADAGKAVTH